MGGCFDILHLGHIHFLREAKKLGDYLIVALESDMRIRKLKGISRPIHTQEQRRQILESLKFVDEVVILKDEMADKDYKQMVIDIAPHIIAVAEGSKTKTHARLVNAKVVEIPKVIVPSTTQIAKLLGIE